MFNGDTKKQKFFDEWYDEFIKVNKRTPTTEEFWSMVDTINKVIKNEDH